MAPRLMLDSFQNSQTNKTLWAQNTDFGKQKLNPAYKLIRNIVIEGLLKEEQSLTFGLSMYPEYIWTLNEDPSKSEKNKIYL